MIKKSILLGTAAALALSINSCGGGEEDNHSTDENTNTSDSTAVVVEDEMDEFGDSYEFVPPSPLQIASIFKKAGLEFNSETPLNPSKSAEFPTSFSQSIAFGMYSADMAYCVMNEKYDNANEYLKALRDLSSKIGLETVFNSEDIMQRFQDNLGNQDSIINILIFIQENTDDYIAENGKEDLSVINYSGAWIEGMYLGAKTVNESGDKEKIGLLISEEMTIAETLLEGLKHVSNQDQDILDLIDSIDEILNTYNGFESVVKAGEEADYIDVLLSEDELSKIANELISLRNNYAL